MVPRALLLFLVGCLLCLLGQVRFYLSLLSVPCKPIPPVAWSPSCGVALTGTHKSLFGPRRHAKPTYCTVSPWERDLCRCPQCEWFTPHLTLRAEVNGEPPLAALRTGGLCQDQRLREWKTQTFGLCLRAGGLCQDQRLRKWRTQTFGLCLEGSHKHG